MYTHNVTHTRISTYVVCTLSADYVIKYEPPFVYTLREKRLANSKRAFYI